MSVSIHTLSLARRTLVALAMVSAVAAPATTLSRYEFVQPKMGTLFQIVLFASDAADARAAANDAFACIEGLNDSMSDYDSASELMRLCAQPAGTPVHVSFPLFDVLQRSVELSGRTAGAFDVTAGPLVRLWREARRTGVRPQGERFADAKARTGFSNVHLNARDRTVTLLSSGMQLDLGGIAKGYAADQALSVLRFKGYPVAMVAASGDLALGDPPPGTDGWSVRIEPFGGDGGPKLEVRASNVGISTSGDAEQFVEIDGIRYSHIIDPRTGLGLTEPLAVTVVARSATDSDSWATACSVLGLKRSREAVARVAGALHVIIHRRGRPAAESFGERPPGLRNTIP